MKLDFLKDNTLLIVPRNGKEKLIKEISKLPVFYSYKIIDDQELKHLLCFDYDITAIDYLHQKYHLKIENAKEYLENLYFIENIDYQNKKLNKLVAIKNDLLANNLLQIDQTFLKTLSNKDIIVYGFDVISKEFKLLLKKLNKPYQIIDINTTNSLVSSVYHFDTLEDECNALCYQISQLLQQNIDINNIKIANVNKDYLFTLKRYFKMYNIAFDNDNSSSLFSLISVHDFINKLKENYDFKEALEYYEQTYPNNLDIYSLLLNLANSMVKLNIKNSFESFLYSLKNTKIPSTRLTNCLTCIDLDNYFVEDEYIFALSVNQGIYPKSYKDEDFFSDDEKIILGLDTSEELNILAKEKFKKLLAKSSKIVLSFKDKTAFASFTKAFVLNENNIIEKHFEFNPKISFSKDVDQLNLAKDYDNIYKNIDNPKTILLASNYQIPYNDYNHEFKVFSGDKIKNYIMENKINLSYSSLNNYYKCAFKYYMNDLLKLTPEIQTTSIDIGKIFHKIFELSYKEDFDFETAFQNEYDNIKNVETAFYLRKFKFLLSEIIRINNQKMADSHLNQVLTEQKVSVNYTVNNLTINFKGYVDKILYTKENDKTYVAIVDYKTGKVDLNLDNVEYGLSMQLPIYLYFLKNFPKFTNVEICGFYLQIVMPETIKYGENYEDILNDSLKLQGYSNSSKSIITMFDSHFDNSNMIKSLKTNKDGSFSNNSKVLSNKDMDNLAQKVNENVQKAIENISNCQFNINPKMIKNKNVSCEYCVFKECCFMAYKDLQHLDLNNNKMEGDEDGD